MTDYPPEDHVLRDLPFETTAVSETRSRAWLSCTDEVCLDGRLAAGPLVTVVDLLAGALAARAVLPDWVATSSLVLHHLDDAPAGGEVVIEAGLLRGGSSAVVMDVKVSHGSVSRRSESRGSTAVAEAVVTFARLPRRDGVNPDLSAIEPRYGERSSFALPDSGLRVPWDEAVGVRTDPVPGRTSTALSGYVRNSFGAMNGGVVASVCAAAARSAAGGTVVEDLVVHYLGQGRTGPVVTTAEVLRRLPGEALVRVEVRDEGGDRLMALAHVTVGMTER